MKGYRNLIVLLMISVCLHIAAARNMWTPIVRNIDSTPCGQIYSLWRISNDSLFTFFAGQGGVFEYDGLRWKKYRLPGTADARGVKVSSDRKRVYVGGEGEFGYLHPERNGISRYVSLSDSLSPAIRQGLGNVFDFYEFGGDVYVRTDFSIGVLNGDKMRIVKSPDKIFSSVIHSGTLYVATENGIKMLSGNRLIDAPGCEILNGKLINAMIDYGKNIIIATATSGLYSYNGKEVKEIETPFRKILNEDIISCAATDGERIALGTVRSGLLLMDMRGESMIFNVENGCHSNMVQSVAFDRRGNLWIGHDYGLDFVNIKSPFSILYPYNDQYGMGNTSVLYDGRLYFGTNRGLYSLPWPETGLDNGALRQVGNLVGTSWWLYPYAGDLLLMHGKGIYRIKGNDAEQLTDIKGAWMCHPIPGHSGKLLVSTYHGAYVIYRDNEGNWHNAGKIEGLDSPGRYFTITGDTLKVFHQKQDSATLYRLSSELTSAKPAGKIHAKYSVSDDILISASAEEWNVQNPPYKLDKSRSIIPFNRGFMLFDKTMLPLLDSGVRIESVVNANTDSILYSANFSYLQPDIRLSGPGASVAIDWDSPENVTGVIFTYSYRLNGEKWSEPSEEKRKIYDGLGSGHYIFEVRKMCGRKVISETSIDFSVITPWYLSRWFFMALILIITGGICIVIIKMKRNIKVLECENETEGLRHKNMEVANLTLNMARKNDILISIKERIMQVTKEVSGGDLKSIRQHLLILTNLIDTNIEDDDILQKFEEQFDIANDNFIRKLSANHPSLNRKERLLCAYSKMNLSTKEIASLMNLTVRGVESMRYRIRKKIALDSDTSLTDYLNSLTDV